MFFYLRDRDFFLGMGYPDKNPILVISTILNFWRNFQWNLISIVKRNLIFNNVNSKFLEFVHHTNLKENFGCHPPERASLGSSWRVSIGACDKWIKLNLTPRVKSGMAILYSEKYFISKSVIGGRAENSKEFSHSVRTLKHFYVKVDVIFPLKR